MSIYPLFAYLVAAAAITLVGGVFLALRHTMRASRANRDLRG
ncbi:hypothetical protein [Thiomonas sp. X19]|nr:hypothetical protein [Thiomonas sp. X19]